MITRQQLNEYLGRRPFQPFRVMLSNGHVVDVTRTNQAVALPEQLVVGTEDDRFRWIRLEQIDRLELCELRPN